MIALGEEQLDDHPTVAAKPLGVGIMSAALKKGALDAAGYAAMIATTTRLNTPGPELAALDDGRRRGSRYDCVVDLDCAGRDH